MQTEGKVRSVLSTVISWLDFKDSQLFDAVQKYSMLNDWHDWQQFYVSCSQCDINDLILHLSVKRPMMSLTSFSVDLKGLGILKLQHPTVPGLQGHRIGILCNIYLLCLHLRPSPVKFEKPVFSTHLYSATTFDLITLDVNALRAD